MNLGTRWALVLVDMQNGFLDTGGFLGQYGLNDRPADQVVANVGTLLAAARQVGAPVIHTRFTLKADGSDAGLGPRFFGFPGGQNGLVAGTWGNAIIEELAPAAGELVIEKTRYSAFHGTELADTLAKLKVDTMVVCGVTADVCVESTVRDAFDLDIMSVVPADATAAVSVEGYLGTIGALRNALAQVSDVATIADAIRSSAADRVS